MPWENLIICCLFPGSQSTSNVPLHCIPRTGCLPSFVLQGHFYRSTPTHSFSFFLGRIPILSSCGTLAGAWSFNLVEQSSSTRFVIKWKWDSLHWQNNRCHREEMHSTPSCQLLQKTFFSKTCGKASLQLHSEPVDLANQHLPCVVHRDRVRKIFLASIPSCVVNHTCWYACAQHQTRVPLCFFPPGKSKKGSFPK